MKLSRDDINFYRGVIAALAVVVIFDAQTVYDEIVRTASVDGLVRVARKDGSMRWSGLSKYGYGKAGGRGAQRIRQWHVNH